MVGKYLQEDCLYVTDPKAVEKLYTILNEEPKLFSSNAKCNKSHDERTAFLNKIKKNL